MRLFRLIDAILDVYDNGVANPKNDNDNLRQTNGMTFCNEAVWKVASKLKYDRFNGLLANQQIEIMESNPEWQEISMASAQETANRGHLVIAGLKGEEHGHVVVVIPACEVISGKWQGKYCPKVMHVGSKCFIDKGVNWAFIDIPKFWVLI